MAILGNGRPHGLDADVLTWQWVAQDVRAGTAVTQRFHGIMQGLVAGMRKQRPEESSIAAHLLDIPDPVTGALSYVLTTPSPLGQEVMLGLEPFLSR